MKISGIKVQPEFEQFKETALMFLSEVHSAALRMTNDAHAAEELTSQVYDRACCEYFDHFKNEIDLRNGLYRELVHPS